MWALLCAAALAPAAARGDAADDQYAVAAGLYTRGEWKLAAEAMATLIEKYPDHAQAGWARYFRGDCLLRLGQYPEARKAFLDYLAQYPKGHYARAALFRAGEAAFLGNQSQEAEKDLKKFLATYPDDELCAFVIPYLGDIALTAKDYATAEKYYRQALADYPEGQFQDDCRVGLAQSLQQKGRTDEAQRLLMAVAAKSGSPRADDAQLRLGALQHSMENYAEAVASFEELEKKFPTSAKIPKARLRRAWALWRLDRVAEAKALLSGLSSDPTLGLTARYWLGMVQRDEQELEAAAKTLLAVAEADPKNPLAASARFHAGDALLRSGDSAGAGRLFDQVIAAAAQDKEWVDDALRGKVQAALKEKNHEQVDQLAARFEKEFPDSPLLSDVRQSLGRSLVQREQFAEAAKVLQPLADAEQGEDTLETRYLLGVAYQGMKRYDEALVQLAEVVKSAQGDLKAQALAAEAAVRVDMGKFSEAIGPLEAYLATNPDAAAAAKARGSLAVCCARSGQMDKARELLDALRESKADAQLVATVTRQLAEAAYAAGDWKGSAELFARPAAGQGEAATRLQSLSGLGWSQYKGGDLAKAEATFKEVLAGNPPEALAAEAALVRGEILQKLDQPDPALAMFDQVIDKYPKSKEHPLALVAAARLCHRLKQDQRAATLYAQRIKAEPPPKDLDKLLYEYGWVLFDLGRSDDCQATFERIRKEFPESPYWADATFRLARWAFDAQDYARANQLAAEVLQRKPEAEVREHVLYLQGQVAAAEKKWPQVRSSFETLLKEFPKTPLRTQAEFWIAETYFRHKDYDVAGEKLDALVRQTQGQKEPWMAMIALRRAQVLAHRDKWAEAYLIASKIAGDYPNFEQQYEVDYVLGRCLASRAEFDEARQAYEKVIASTAGAKTETAAMAQWMIGESYFHQKNYEAALRAYMRVEILYAFPQWQAAALLQAAKCRELLGEWSQAVSLYDQLLEKYPDTPYAEDAKSRLPLAKRRLADAASGR